MNFPTACALASLSRRHFLSLATIAPLGAVVSCRSPAPATRSTRGARFVFVTGGQTVLMNVDGTGRRVLEFDVPEQAPGSQPGSFPTVTGFYC